MPLTTAGGLNCSRLRSSSRCAQGGEARVESHEILFMVSSDADILAVHGDEESHEEATETISTVPSRDRARGLQETLAISSYCENRGLEKGWWSVSR